MESRNGILLTLEQWEGFQKRYGFQLDDGIVILVEGSILTAPSPGKIGIYIKHFDAGYYLSSFEFLLELLYRHKVHINRLVPNGVNKIIAFEMLCRCNEIVPDLWVFRHFFRLSASSTGDNYTL